MTEEDNSERLKQLTDGVNVLKNESIRLKKEISGAKTSYKRKYYTKKLKKNNKDFFHALYLYDRISKQEQIKKSNNTSEETSG